MSEFPAKLKPIKWKYANYSMKSVYQNGIGGFVDTKVFDHGDEETGKKIKRLRDERHISIPTFANLLGISMLALANLEAGRMIVLESPKEFDKIVKITKTLNHYPVCTRSDCDHGNTSYIFKDGKYVVKT